MAQDPRLIGLNELEQTALTQAQAYKKNLEKKKTSLPRRKKVINFLKIFIIISKRLIIKCVWKK